MVVWRTLVYSSVSGQGYARCVARDDTTESHERWLRETFALARAARLAGNHPFGALLVLDGRVVLRAQNTVASDRNPTAHAETNLMAAALRSLAAEDLVRAVLYTSCEPCAMCAGTMYWGGIRTVVFGLSAFQLARLAGSDLLVPCRELFARGAHAVDVTGPLLADEAAAVHEHYWPPPARHT